MSSRNEYGRKSERNKFYPSENELFATLFSMISTKYEVNYIFYEK